MENASEFQNRIQQMLHKSEISSIETSQSVSISQQTALSQRNLSPFLGHFILFQTGFLHFPPPFESFIWRLIFTRNDFIKMFLMIEEDKLLRKLQENLESFHR